MARAYSLSYLTSHRSSAVEAVRLAAECGYACIGFRLWPNAVAGPVQELVGRPALLRETLAALRDTGVKVLDVEIIRIDEGFDPHRWDAMYDTVAALGGRAILVAADDRNEARLTASYAHLCEVMARHGLTADLEFMPWTAVKDAKAALRIIDAAGRPANAGILVDALHFGRSTTTLEDIRSLPRELLHYAQICDATAGTGFTDEELVHTARCARLPPGEGTIDLPGLFAALPRDLPVSVEVIHLEREREADPVAWARLCLEASRPYCD
ncbi:MAG: Xylose isomerase domain protein barrel [Ramlibacter sp.]|jgi:sugar phosphate isomerase/epimerase|nr:Xylose isomerase domain protein barrel [Ramlibacter sp.]